MLCATLTTAATASAQDATEPAAEPVVVEAPPPTAVPPTPVPPTPVPPTPTPVPPTPTPIPPTATLEPTAAPATDAPSTEQPDNPVEAPTDPAGSPDVAVTPTVTPTETPTPTPTAESALTYALVEQPRCELAPDQPSSIASGGSLDYTCTDTVSITGTNIVPSNVGVTWSTRALVEGGWSVQILPPKHNSDDVVEWSPANLSETRFTFEQRDPAGTSTEVGDVTLKTVITYRVRLTRGACAVESETLWLTHDVTVSSPDATAELDPPLTSPREPLRITPDLLSIPEPSVSFDGGLNFGEVGITASGLSESTRTGTLAVTVSNLDLACGEWSVLASATTLTAEDGTPLEGSSLVVVAVDGVAPSNGSCDLSNGCALATFTASPSAQSTQSITLTVELRMPEYASIGAFQTTLDAVLSQTGSPGATDSPQQTQDPVDP
jgi:hypothetical protein